MCYKQCLRDNIPRITSLVCSSYCLKSSAQIPGSAIFPREVTYPTCPQPESVSEHGTHLLCNGSEAVLHPVVVQLRAI